MEQNIQQENQSIFGLLKIRGQICGVKMGKSINLDFIQLRHQ